MFISVFSGLPRRLCFLGWQNLCLCWLGPEMDVINLKRIHSSFSSVFSSTSHSCVILLSLFVAESLLLHTSLQIVVERAACLWFKTLLSFNHYLLSGQESSLEAVTETRLIGGVTLICFGTVAVHLNAQVFLFFTPTLNLHSHIKISLSRMLIM